MTSDAQETSGGNDSGRAKGMPLGGLDYHIIFDAAGSGMAFTEFGSGRIMDVNAAWIRRTGIAREKAVGRTALELGLWASPADREACLAELDKKGRVADFEARLVTKSGELPHLMSAESFEMGGKRCILWEFRDISEQKRINEALMKSEETIKALLAGSEKSRRILLGILEDEKQAKDALREQHDLLANVIEGTNVGTWRWNVQTGEMALNKRWAEIVGYTLEELSPASAQTWNNLAHRDDLKESDAQLEKHFAGTLDYYDCECRLRHKNGSWVWVQDRGRVIEWTDDGRPLVMAGTELDISERKRAEDALRESRNRLQSLFETMAEGVVLITPDGQIVQANLAAERILGISRSEIASRNYTAPDWEIIRPDGTPMPPEEMAGPRAMEEKRPIKDMVMGVKRPDGSVSWINVCAAPLLNSAGELEGVVGTFGDITERRRAEEGLKKAEQDYRMLAENSPDLIARFDTGLRHLYVNPAAARAGKLSASEYAGLTIAESGVPEPAATAWDQRLGQVLRTGKTLDVEDAFLTPEGIRYFHTRLIPERTPDGSVWSVLSVAHDITERRRAEEALRESEERFRRVIENAPFGYYRVGKDGLWQYVNPVWERMHGLSLEQVVGKPFEITQPEDAVEQARELVKRALVGESIAGEFSRLTGEGRIQYHSFNIQPVKRGSAIVAIEGFIDDITERRRAEEALRESEEKFRSLFNRIPDGVYRSTPAGRFVDVNPAMVKMLGYDSREEMLALDIPKDLYFALEEREAGFLDTGQGKFSVFRLRRKDGSEIWAEDHGDYVYDEQGNILFHEGILRDVTERRRAEEALRQSEARFRILFDRANDGIVILSLDGKLVSVNESFAHMHGYSVEEMQHMSLKDLDTPETFQRVPERMARVGAGEPLTFEVEHYHKDGHVFPLEVSTSLISAGGESFIQCFHRDITKRRRAEQALRESEARMRTLYENSMVGILLADAGGRALAANPAACRLFGRTEEDIRRTGRSGLVDNRDPRVNAFLREREEKGYAMGEVTLVRGDGTRFPGQVASARFETEEGPRTSLVIQDLSERKLAEERIRDFSRKLLSVREEDKRRLSSVLHHDVGSFTVGVMAQLHAAEDGLRAGKSKEALASLKECRRVFSESVKRLKSLAVELRPPDLDILGLGAALRQHFVQLSRETSLRIHFTDATHGAAITPEVQTVLFRAAQECLNNVVKHARAAHARVRLSASEQGIRLSLADDGKGFDPGEVAQRSGAHLGLRAVQEMVATPGGVLDIASKPGKGTKVTVTIPGRGNGEGGGQGTVNSEQ